MNTLRRLAAAALAAVLLTGLTAVTATPAQALTGIGNGSFETPVVTPGTFQDFHPGQLIGAWTVIQGNVDLIGAGFWQAADGVQSLDLDGSEFPLMGGVAQTFSTIPLLKYRVTYRLAGNPAGGPQVKTGQIRANGNVIQSFSFDTTGRSFANMGYVHQETHLIATSLSTALEIRSTTGSGFGPVIDDVDVESCLLVICLG
jgi:choice-of-anchor C domain-containing protein